jgi:two-component system, OmpR family, sensor histidine kinase BaeS
MMFRTLRQRLIWSQIIPLLLALPLMGVLLIYSLEGQILIPQLAKNLVNNARLLAEISRAEFELWGDPILFERLISRVQLDSDIQVMFLDGQGSLLYSTDPDDLEFRGQVIPLPGLSKAQSGTETALTNYSISNLSNVVVDVYEPVTDVSSQVVGIVRLTYRLDSLYDIFSQLRGQILAVLGLGLLLSLLLGTGLAVSISRPVREVTEAIYGLATEQRREPVQERGPEELRSQARAVNFLVEQLHSLETSRRQLLANIVHELGRPLGALRSATHALGKGAAEDPSLLNDLKRGMDEETSRLQYLLDELANLYDKAMGELELDRKPIQLTAWLRDILIPWKAAAEEKQIQWQEDIPQSLPSISIDAMRMAQVVGNILSNAIKYTPPGGSVKIAASADERTFLLNVSDTGAGVHEEEREKIFLPFYRGDTGRRIKQGMGLGLTIARDLVTAHGGEIRVESTPGMGSEFTMKIPLE